MRFVPQHILRHEKPATLNVEGRELEIRGGFVDKYSPDWFEQTPVGELNIARECIFEAG